VVASVLTQEELRAYEAREAPERAAHLAELQRRRDRETAKAAHVFGDLWAGVDAASALASARPIWKLKATDYGNGLREACVWLHRPDPARDLECYLDREIPDKAARGEGDREASAARARRRAKQQVRGVCKTLAINSLWTLTYRANVTDRDLVLKHLDRFRRKVEAVLPGWKYVAVLQRQERGAWHVHLATHALPKYLAPGGVVLKSWDVMRGIWLGIVGELGGNFDEAKRPRRWSKRCRPVRGAGAIASYIAGYVAKDMDESELNRRRYSRSKGVEIPEAERHQWDHEAISQAELIELAYAAVGESITRAWFDRASGVFFVESDDTLGLASHPS